MRRKYIFSCFFQNAHFCVCDFMFERIFLSCYKKIYTEFAMAKVTFFVQMEGKFFFLLMFGVWILAFFWEKSVPFQKSAPFCTKTTTRENAPTTIFVFIFLTWNNIYLHNRWSHRKIRQKRTTWLAVLGQLNSSNVFFYLQNTHNSLIYPIYTL